MDSLKIAVDAQGGDRAPGDVIEGVRRFLASGPDARVILTGKREEIEPLCADLDVEIVHAPSVVGMHESPSAALKSRKDSSIAAAVQLVRDGKADALLSMGNSGAAVAFAMFLLGRIGNIPRPGIVAPMPRPDGYTLLIDAGANVDCKPAHLLHFAIMASAYCRLAFNVEKPRVGLLSIGEEESKGNELTLETAKLLASAPIRFIGNVEGSDIMRGTVDVVVCDGFIGNVILKFGEGMVEMFASTLKFETEEVLGGDIDRSHKVEFLRETMARVDYNQYGAAILLGVRGHCLIGHGRSGPEAIANGIRAASTAARKCPLDEIQKALEAAPIAVA